MAPPADLVVVNGRVITLDPACPAASCIAVRDGRVLSCGDYDTVRSLIGASSIVIDAEGAVVAPAFHDAHLHFLSYARQQARLDCSNFRSIAELQTALRTWAETVPAGAWVRAVGYDDLLLTDGRHPDHLDLDDAVSDRPVQVQHRSLHLDLLNTRALRESGLWDSPNLAIERHAETDEPTGRLFHAVELLRDRMPHAAFTELAADVRRASTQLLAWGVTSIQDASVTNGATEWEVFRRLAEGDALRQRTWVFAGSQHWREMTELQTPGGRVRRGPVKFMVSERQMDLAELRSGLDAAWAAGRSVAIHATSEAEVVIALEALRCAPSTPGTCAQPHRARIGHRRRHDSGDPRGRRGGCGESSWIYLRGDAYREEYPPELHPSLHRARSLLNAAILYTIGSDAPVAEPCPGVALFAARQRRTRSGSILGEDERLAEDDALAAITLGPARVIGADHELGRLQPGALADLVLMDHSLLEGSSIEDAHRPVRMTIKEGCIVWTSAE